MATSRRDVLKAAFSGSVLLSLRGSSVLAQTANEMLWVQVMATGGWDQAMFTDPKQGLRTYGSAVPQQAGAITYVNFPEVAPFFTTHASRMLVFQGVDTFTNNHDAGVRHSMSGSMLEGFPIFAAQVAAAKGADRLLPMFTLYDYNESGGLFAPNPIDYASVATFEELKGVNRPPNEYANNGAGSISSSSGVFLPEAVRTRLAAAHAARTQRLLAGATLPNRVASLERLQAARAAALRMPELNIASTGVVLPAGVSADSQLGKAMTLAARGVDAFKAGLSASVVVGLGAFDTHGGQPDSTQLEQLDLIFKLANFVLAYAQTAGVPTGVLMCSDFGRTPEREGATGTGHWPISTMIVAQNAAGFALGKLPGNRVIGGTTGEVSAPNPMVSKTLLARKINPATLAFSDTGVVMTPAHIFRALRRAAGIDASPALRDFKLNIDVGTDLVLS